MTVSIRREAAGLAGVAWATFALQSGLVPGGSASSVGAAVAIFRELYNENRSAVVDALADLAIITREAATTGLPATLPPSATLTSQDLVALELSIYPMVEFGRLVAASRLPASQQGASLATTDAPNFGTAADLLAVFRAAPATEAGMRAWFARLTAVWPRGSNDPYAQTLWSFANNIAGSAAPGPILDRAFTSYVFQGGVNGDPMAVSATTSVQSQAAAVTTTGSAAVVEPLPTDTSGDLVAPTELGETYITARAAGRSAWFYFVVAAAILGMGGLAWYLWSYRQAKPWRR